MSAYGRDVRRTLLVCVLYFNGPRGRVFKRGSTTRLLFERIRRNNRRHDRGYKESPDEVKGYTLDETRVDWDKFVNKLDD
ncbi:hypothetical protein NDU88_002043 [Pleurodeles waltl]|uniref:Uncharacterized protein n=1 Tax=Pleurodeles waltl TaxID=8319 RepID=A0AAV7W1W5_PLEWA|nr:hypothetical protein NDU88_002043 [Pleurodeles waltl]